MGQRAALLRIRAVTGRSAAGRAEPTTKRRLGREERRAAIVDGAAVAFARGGYAASSMADIAAAAGVSHLIIYRHFESKEALYETVLERALDSLSEALAPDTAVGVYGPTPSVLLSTARADSAGFESLFRHASREPDFQRWSELAWKLLADLTESALASNVARSHLRWAARATVVYIVEAVLVWVEDGDPLLDARFVAATNAALRAGVKSWARSS